MSEPIEAEYFNWLCAKVIPRGGRQYYDLLRILYQTEFVVVVRFDENRVEDGLELRTYFLNQTRWEMDPQWFNEPVSVLEVLISFAERASFQTDRPARDWFWEMMTNLELGDFRQITRQDIPFIEDVLRGFVLREYRDNGYGGIFPLHWPKRDQRRVEIWYQFCDYLDDRGLM